MPYDLFISYAHRDNARRQVTEFRDAISEDFQKFAGRELTIFFDEHDIPSMADWEKRIAQGLRESRLFLAVLSPNYFASAYCRREWEEYVRYEAMRQCLGEGVAPVYFIELPGLDGPGVEQSIVAAVDEMRKRQWCDLASQKPIKIIPWHDAGKRALEDVEVARRLKALKEQMAERLNRADRAQQSPTNFYRHNPQFVGRVRELSLLREALNERGSVGVVGHKTQTSGGATAVHGLGGMGKTELALAYAHAFAWDYPGGRWLARCEGLDNFDLVLHQLAEPLQVEFTEEEKKDTHRAGERILAELRRCDRSLLLLDNVTHSGLLGPEVLMRLPPQGHVHLLTTTRLGPVQLAGSPHDHTFVAVDELPTGDALALIRAHQPDARFTNTDDEAAARELVKLLDGFTLAVETAAIYLGRHVAPDTIAGYTERLRHELLDESERSAADPAVAVRHKEKLLERTLSITFETLSAEKLHVLLIAALLPADQIAVPWLRVVARNDFPQLPPYAGTAADGEWMQIEDDLLGLRLFTSGLDPHVVRMHRMVQQLIGRRAGVINKSSYASTSNAATQPTQSRSWLGRIFARPRPTSQPQTVATLSELIERENPVVANTRGHLIAHIDACSRNLDQEWVKSENRWEIEPLRATAWHWMEANEIAGAVVAQSISLPLNRLCLWADAESLLRRALELYERHFGASHERVGIACNNLAEALRGLGRPVEAEQFHRRALEILDADSMRDSPEVGQILNNRALSLAECGRYREAEPLYRRALAIAESVYGSDHLEVARALSNLGLVLCETSRSDEAEAPLLRAIDIVEKQNGANHPFAAVCKNNLAGVLDSKGRFDEAETLYRQALAADESSFGRNHSMTALRMHNLAHVLFEKQNFAEAESLLREALAAQEGNPPPNHPQHAATLTELAALLIKTGRGTEAEPLLREALRIHVRRSVQNLQENPPLHASMRNYHDMLRAIGKTEADAKCLVKETLTQEGMTGELFLKTIRQTGRQA